MAHFRLNLSLTYTSVEILVPENRPPRGDLLFGATCRRLGRIDAEAFDVFGQIRGARRLFEEELFVDEFVVGFVHIVFISFFLFRFLNLFRTVKGFRGTVKRFGRN